MTPGKCEMNPLRSLERFLFAKCGQRGHYDRDATAADGAGNTLTNHMEVK